MKNKLTKTKEVTAMGIVCNAYTNHFCKIFHEFVHYLSSHCRYRRLRYFSCKRAALAGTVLLVPALLPLAGCEERADFSEAKGSASSSLLSRILSNDIVFYGQVLDLDGNPVPHAKINYSSLNSGNFDKVWTGGGPKNKIMYTDESGRFEIHEVGGSLYVNCTHSDYYGNKDSKEGSQRKFGYGFQVGDAPAWNPQNPAIFRLRKKGIREPLYYSCSEVIGKGQPWIRVPEGGIEINLANGELQKSATSIYISCKEGNGDYSWEYTLNIPGGGFIKKRRFFDFIAPLNGYSQEVKIGQSGENGNWKYQETCHYFVKFPNGLYGVFEIQASFTGGAILFQALVNPNPSSRNMEYEYKMQINKNQRGDSYGYSL